MKKLFLTGLLFTLSLSASYSHWTGVGAMSDAKYGQVSSGLVLELNQSGSAITGTVSVSNKPYTITTGTVQGSSISLSFQAGSALITATLSQNGSKMTGTMTSSDGKVMNVQLTQQ